MHENHGKYKYVTHLSRRDLLIEIKLKRICTYILLVRLLHRLCISRLKNKSHSKCFSSNVRFYNAWWRKIYIFFFSLSLNFLCMNLFSFFSVCFIANFLFSSCYFCHLHSFHMCCCSVYVWVFASFFFHVNCKYSYFVRVRIYFYAGFFRLFSIIRLSLSLD